METVLALSESEQFRQRGNEIVRTLNSLSKALHEDRLKKGLDLYTKALNSAQTTYEKVTALKNLGVTSKMLANCVEMLSQGMHHKEQGIVHLTAAIHAYDGKSLPQSWKCDVESKLYDLVITYISDLQEDSAREEKLSKLCTTVHETAKSRCYLALNQLYFGKALKKLDEKDFKRALHLFGECYTPLQEAERFLHLAHKDDNVTQNVLQDMSDQVHCTESAARAHQFIHFGDDVHNKAVYIEESLSISMIWNAIDNYQQAIVYSLIYNDLESEAIAQTRIGLIYVKILKLHSLGYVRLKHAFDLAESMKPARYFVNEDWYKSCVSVMQEHQEEKRKLEEEQLAKSRAPYLEKLKEQLKVIREKSEESPYDLLSYIYDKHPPKNQAKLEKEIKPEELKKTLQKAVCHYHPDKNSSEKFGMEWFVLSEEICKYISRHYERQKMPEPQTPSNDDINEATDDKTEETDGEASDDSDETEDMDNEVNDSDETVNTDNVTEGSDDSNDANLDEETDSNKSAETEGTDYIPDVKRRKSQWL